MEDLHIKYRPKTFANVIGHEEEVASIINAIHDGRGHTILLTGPSGVGKTTIARLIAAEVGCSRYNLREIDAATHTGIDAMREVAEALQFKAMGNSKTKVVIIDEAHALSKAAIQSLLKVLEEPPANTYWVLCTTEPAKIIQTVITRCLVYDLKPIDANKIQALLKRVAKKEKIKLKEDILDLLVKEAYGSPRQALTYLQVCSTCKTRKQAAKMIGSAESSEPLMTLCRLLVRGRGITWPKVRKLLKNLEGTNNESIRLTILAYFTKCIMGTDDQKKVLYYLSIIENFDQPFNQSEKLAPVILALGVVLFREDE